MAVVEEENSFHFKINAKKFFKNSLKTTYIKQRQPQEVPNNQLLQNLR